MIFDYLGHNGSEIVNDMLPEPIRRRGFTVEEIVDFLMYKGYRPVYIQAEIVHENGYVHVYKTMNYKTNIQRLNNYLSNTPCVLLGSSDENTLPHAVYWNGDKILDPCGVTYEIGDFKLMGILLVI